MSVSDNKIVSTPDRIKPDFFHIVLSDAIILEYLDWYPGATVGAMQNGMGFHRGSKKFRRVRREITWSVQRLIVTGYISKNGVQNFLTEKGIKYLITNCHEGDQ